MSRPRNVEDPIDFFLNYNTTEYLRTVEVSCKHTPASPEESRKRFFLLTIINSLLRVFPGGSRKLVGMSLLTGKLHARSGNKLRYCSHLIRDPEIENITTQMSQTSRLLLVPVVKSI